MSLLDTKWIVGGEFNMVEWEGGIFLVIHSMTKDLRRVLAVSERTCYKYLTLTRNICAC